MDRRSFPRANRDTPHILAWIAQAERILPESVDTSETPPGVDWTSPSTAPKGILS